MENETLMPAHKSRKSGILVVFMILLSGCVFAQPGKENAQLYLGDVALGMTSSRSDTLLSIRTEGTTAHDSDYVITHIALSTPGLSGPPVQLPAREVGSGYDASSSIGPLLKAVASGTKLRFEVNVVYKNKLRMKFAGEYTML